MPGLYDDAQRISNSFSSSLMPFGFNTNERTRVNKAARLTRTLHEPMSDTKANGVFTKVESISPKNFTGTINHASQTSIEAL